MMTKLKEVMDRAGSWPKHAQEELAAAALEIEAGVTGVYHATPEELEAIDQADRSGVATAEEVSAAFATFRRA